MPIDLEAYRQALLELYLRLPDTPRRLSRFDLRLVRQLWERQIPVSLMETAFLLASARRATRRSDAMPLGPIRSFLPVIASSPTRSLTLTSLTCAAKSHCVRRPA